jgi:uncharacterized membrane protein (DUF4010 family)
MIEPVEAVLGILVAALAGAAVGIEREWSGHASGPGARFGGVRTFTLLGGFAGLAGWLWRTGAGVPAAILMTGAVALVVVAYGAASRRDVDATTEVAALVVLAAGLVAGLGWLALSSGIVAITSLLLLEKPRLHALVARLDDTGLRAGVRFAVMAVVVLPLLPVGPYGPLGGVKPRELWALVLFFSGLSFAGYIARRALGPHHGYAVTGLLGGLISSTNVTLTFSRASRERPEAGGPLARGVIAACSVSFVRVAVATAVINASLLPSLAPYLLLPLGAGLGALVIGRRARPGAPARTDPDPNPLGFRAALQMAVLFQIVLFGVHVASRRLGQAGLLLSGAILGVTDVDALTVSMAKAAASGARTDIAARAITVGILSNSLLKLTVAVFVGRSTFRRLAGVGLAVMAVAVAAGLLAFAPPGP